VPLTEAGAASGPVSAQSALLRGPTDTELAPVGRPMSTGSEPPFPHCVLGRDLDPVRALITRHQGSVAGAEGAGHPGASLKRRWLVPRTVLELRSRGGPRQVSGQSSSKQPTGPAASRTTTRSEAEGRQRC
jgi:hypothetical protein